MELKSISGKKSWYPLILVVLGAVFLLLWGQSFSRGPVHFAADTTKISAQGPAQERAIALQAEGLSLLSQHQISAGFAQLIEAVHLNPHLAKAQFALGLLYRNAGLFFPARQHLEAATQADPDNSAAWALLGTVCGVDLGYRSSVTTAYPEAEQAFQQAAALSPNNLLYRLDWADMEMQNGRLDAAERNYRLALVQEPGNPDAQLRFSRFLIEHRPGAAAQQEAEPLINQAAAEVPGNLNVILLQARLSELRQDYPHAAASLHLALMEQPENAVTWYALSQCERRLGDSAQADTAESHARMLQQQVVTIRHQEEVVSQKPNNAAAHLQLARLNAQAARYPQAINEYQVSLEITPQNKAARQELTRLEAHLKAHGKMPSMGAFNAMVSAAMP